MRLLYVIDSLAPGGAETSLAEMAPGLVNAHIDLHVLPLKDQLDLAPRLQDSGAVIHRNTGRGRARVRNVRSVIKVAKSIRPDAIHTTLFEADVAARIAALALGIPASTSLVSDSYDASHYQESSAAKLHAARAVDAATGLIAHRFHAITHAIAQSVAPRLWIPSGKIEVIPRGRNPLRFPFKPPGERERIRQQLGITRHAPVILAIGRQEPQKGLQHLLAATQILGSNHSDLVVIIAGREGRATPTLKSTALAIRRDIRFLGHRTDVSSLLSAADVLCFPSEREGLGGVLIEAMAVGCPIVATSIPTSREVLGSGTNSVGLLTPPGDHVALATSINYALTNRQETAMRATRARQRFEHNFTLDRIVERMAAFFTNRPESK